MWNPMKRAKGRTSTFRPRIEVLEDRTCLSASIVVAGPLLFIKGNSSDNAVTITDHGNGTVEASITDGSNTISKTGTKVNAIIVLTGDGDDTVDYNLTGPLTRVRALTINTGDGVDNVDLDFSGQVISSKALGIALNTGSGNDVVTAEFDDIVNTKVGFTTFLGNSDTTVGDKYTTTMTGNLAGRAYFGLVVFGGDGLDTITFDAGAGVDLSSKGALGLAVDGGSGDDVISVNYVGDIDSKAALALTVNGGSGNDTVELTYAGEIDGTLTAEVNGKSGEDTLTTALTANSGSSGKLYAVERGGDNDDDLTFTIADNSGGTLKIKKAELDGGSGTDTVVAATPNVTQKNIP